MLDPYTGELNDKNIAQIFEGAADFIRRELVVGDNCIYAYAIDGLIASGDASEYIFKPIVEAIGKDSVEKQYIRAKSGVIYNCVAVDVGDLKQAAHLLVNGFCVVLFPGAGAIAYEVKTPDKRGTSAPQVENTVKGAKDAFVETIRSNTSYIRRHLRTPDLRIFEMQIGRRSLTNVSVLWIKDLTNDDLVSKLKQRLELIDVDALLSPSAVEEYFTGSRSTAFPLLQYTERTDRFCQGLLDGELVF